MANPRRNTAPANAASDTSCSTPSPPAPRAPSLPLRQPRPLQRARDAASRLLGYSSRAPSPRDGPEHGRFAHGGIQFMRSVALGQTQDASTSHRTGVEIRTLSINESGSHAIVAGKEIFKTVKIEDGRCAEDFNLRTAIRGPPTTAAGHARHSYSIDIADVAWARGDTGNFVAAATSSGKIIVYDLGHAGLQAAQLHEHFRQVHNVTFNPHKGSLLLSGSQDGTVRLWDIRDVRDVRSQASTIASKRKYSGQSEGVRDVKWSPTEGLDFAFATDTGEILRWDMRNLKAAKVRIPAHMGACNTVDWHPDGKHMVSAGTDKSIRVFDVSATRPSKACWEIKAPHPVMNARWRPPCQSRMPQDHGAGLCTQVVAAYDRDHPMLHIWDFRRPLLPFREMWPYPSAPTDLLWHSQDLLWTVGREGTFLQTDVHHTPKVIDRCNLQTIGISPLGELAFISQKREQRRVPKPQPLSSPPPQHTTSLSTSPDNNFFSRSLGDDTLDQSFLGVLPAKRQTHTSTRSTSSSDVGTCTGSQKLTAVVKLDDILLNRKSYTPPQSAFVGQLPSVNNRNYVASVAKNVLPELPHGARNEEFIDRVDVAFVRHAEHFDKLGFSRCSQTWKMLALNVRIHLKKRLRKQRELARLQPTPAANGDGMSITALAYRLAATHVKQSAESPASMQPMSTITQQLAMSENNSNLPTPLARPAESGQNQTRPHQPPLPDPDEEHHIALPPSLAPAHSSPPTSDHLQEFRPARKLTLTNLSDMQSRQTYEQQAERNEMVKRWSSQSKNALDIDPIDEHGVKIPPAQLEHHGSGESFQFLQDSASSRGASFPGSFESARARDRGLPMVSAHPTRPRSPRPPLEDSVPINDDADAPAASDSMFFNGSGTLSAVDTRQNSGNTSMETSHEDLQRLLHQDPTHKTDSANPREVPERRSAAPKSAIPCQTSTLAGAPSASKPSGLGHDAYEHGISALAIDDDGLPHEPTSPTDRVLDAADFDVEENAVWSLIGFLRQLIRHYTTEEPYPQFASLLLLLIGPLLPRTHPLPRADTHQALASYVDYFINALGWDPEEVPSLMRECFAQPIQSGLHPLQVESILASYHEQLLRRQLFDEAALVRTLAYPAYPAVYEDSLRDHQVHSTCGRCRTPLPGRRRPGALRCPGCRATPAPCPHCRMARSPHARDRSRLLTACIRCGHSAHMACFEHWFVACHGAACLTEGCPCECAHASSTCTGPEAAGKQPQHARVKSDEGKAHPSRAASGARRELCP